MAATFSLDFMIILFRFFADMNERFKTQVVGFHLEGNVDFS